MTTDGDHDSAGRPSTGRSDATRSAADGAPLSWSAPIHARHAGKAMERALPVLLDRRWLYEPASCMTGVRVVALRVADGVFVCPLCGLRKS